MRNWEPFHRIVENPLTPEQILTLRPLLNNMKERIEESRVEIYSALLFSYLGNGNGEEIYNLLTEFPEFVNPVIMRTLSLVACEHPQVIKVNLEYVCLYFSVSSAREFIIFCLNKVSAQEMDELLLFVHEMRNHAHKPFILELLNKKLKLSKSKIL